MKLEEEIKQKEFGSEHHKLLLNVIFTSAWINSFHTQMLKPHGISSQQFNILRILRGQHPKPAQVNLLIDRMLDKMSNASRLVEKLRLKGLVERHTCPNDRRAVNVIITQKGLDLLKTLDKTESKWSSIFENISQSEAKQVNRILDKFRG